MTIIISLYSRRAYSHFCFPQCNLMQLIISQTARCEPREYDSTADDMRRTNMRYAVYWNYTQWLYVKEGVHAQWEENYKLPEIGQCILYLTRSWTNGYGPVVGKIEWMDQCRSQRILRSQACLAYEIEFAITLAWNSWRTSKWEIPIGDSAVSGSMLAKYQCVGGFVSPRSFMTRKAVIFFSSSVSLWQIHHACIGSIFFTVQNNNITHGVV